MSLPSNVQQARAFIRARIGETPIDVGVILGSGLGAFGDALGSPQVIPYSEIPGMPGVTIAGHAGKLIIGSLGDRVVACLQGRAHAYEGHDMSTVTFGARLLAALPCPTVLLTNAAGGIHPSFQPGDFMLLTDHLNLMGRNPLVGPNDPSLGERFPDMSEVYSTEVRACGQAAASELGLELRSGVYAALLGPSYETPAEIRMLRTLGADAVGMSTVPEAIVLRHQHLRVGALSCITNLAAGISPHPLSHMEVEAVGKSSRDRLVALLTAWVRKLPR